jgi:hypothetical protein
MRLWALALVLCILTVPFGFVGIPGTNATILTDPILAHTLTLQGLTRRLPVAGSGVACSGITRHHPYVIYDTKYGVIGGMTCMSLGE